MDTINTESGYILTQYDSGGMLTNDAILAPGGKCDELLRQFHRVDEGIGIEGKWAGGSVTGVCRGWGSTKVRTKSCLYFHSKSCCVVNIYLLSYVLVRFSRVYL